MGDRRNHARSLPGLLLCAALGCSIVKWSGLTFVSAPSTAESNSRREALTRGTFMAGLMLPVMGAPENAEAFPNRAEKFKGGIKTNGPNPGDLGLMSRGQLGQRDGEEIFELRQCDPRPNCFSTTFPSGDFQLQPYKFSGKTGREAMQDIVAVINEYKPGQRGIDGGGFGIQESNSQYTYVVFESAKKGYQDDVEFAITPGDEDKTSGTVLVRSGSRIGYYDYGVNAIRMNALTEALRKKSGWTAPPIDLKSHPVYWDKLCNAKDEDGNLFLKKKLKDFC